MKVRDILPNYPLKRIEVRTNGPFGEDMLFGYCYWTGSTLLSLDGDNYYLGETVTKYEFDEMAGKLVYWIKSFWSNNRP